MRRMRLSEIQDKSLRDLQERAEKAERELATKGRRVEQAEGKLSDLQREHKKVCGQAFEAERERDEARARIEWVLRKWEGKVRGPGDTSYGWCAAEMRRYLDGVVQIPADELEAGA